ncbi:MAG: shikimate kinase [Lachnospiraceae bacterium]|nr:shikimate kinase [Lachnospiraceae bacterium]
MKNIVLIGMPASGKSTIGVILAKVMGMDFLDADLVIQKREKKRLADIIEEVGVEGFLKVEEEALLSIETNHPTVIATGGSAVYSEKGMGHLKEDAKVVYLEVSLEDLKQRLSNIKDRGVVVKNGQGVEDIYKERLPLYECYQDITISEAGKTPEDIVEEIEKITF